MTPEEEWLHDSLRRDRERAMWSEILETDDSVRVWRSHGRENSFAWVCYSAAVFLALILVLVYWS